MGLGLLIPFINVNPVVNPVVIGFTLLILNELITFFFSKPIIKGLIVINYDSINFSGTIIKIENMDYFAIRYLDYRGKIVYSRSEYPLPKSGTNNEIKLRTKSGEYFESNFFIARKRDRKKIDKFINYWIEKGIKIDYIIENKLIIKNR